LEEITNIKYKCCQIRLNSNSTRKTGIKNEKCEYFFVFLQANKRKIS